MYTDSAAHTKALLSAIRQAQQSGRPVLVGTDSVSRSEELSAVLTTANIAHHVLNARNDAQEAALIAQAGQSGALTISTNMAGRGVDILLDEKARAAGGLLVIGSCFYANDRIDAQLRGRAGRQGDPGESCFFIDSSRLPEDIPLQHSDCRQLRRMRRLLTAQEKNARQILLRYKALEEQQRRIITAQRRTLLESPAATALLTAYAPALYAALTAAFGSAALAQAEKQLLLQTINTCWSNYLESMTDIRQGIHLTIIGGQNPLDEYRKIALQAFAEMQDDILSGTLAALQSALTQHALPHPDSTSPDASILTYRIDESKNQFSCLPRLMKELAAHAQGTLFKRRHR